MRRRELLVLCCGGMLVSPLAARAQGRTRIGYLGAAPRSSASVRAFFDELKRLGYAEGRNLDALYHDIGEDPGRLPQFAAAMAGAHLGAIVADGSEAPLRAARAAAPGTPVVIVAVNYDPVARGYAASLAHPGGEVTGVLFRSLEIVGKQVELLKTMMPRASRLTIVWGVENPDEFAAAKAGAKAQGLDVQSFELGPPPYDFEAMFRRLAQGAPAMVLMLSPPGFAAHHRRVAGLALRHRLPAMFRFKDFVEAGGLISYGVNRAAMRRRAADYVAKILAGARPGDLPIERADTFELAVNLKTARALGIVIPPRILARADEVIQ
ncbi:MAG TPA: ABC transporter substrate-binding protein [Stellaceae bacterium]|nr:ABC transporter substrate-binding protein [Stellaceae bacterium]